MITIYIYHFAYRTTDAEIATSFVNFIESMGFEVRTEITEYIGVIDHLQKVM